MFQFQLKTLFLTIGVVAVLLQPLGELAPRKGRQLRRLDRISSDQGRRSDQREPAGEFSCVDLQIDPRVLGAAAEPMAADIEVAFPIDSLKKLVVAGAIGDAAPRHLSFMGSITAPARLVRESAPAAADLLVADQVDVALLVPV